LVQRDAEGGKGLVDHREQKVERSADKNGAKEVEMSVVQGFI